MKSRHIVFLAIAVLTPASVGAQLDVATPSPTFARASEPHRPGPSPSARPTLHAVSPIQAAPPDSAVPDPRFLHVTLAAGAGALAGGAAAALFMRSADRDGSYGSGAGGMLILAGAVGGGTVGALSATNRPADSFRGSLLGTVGALLFAAGVDRAAESAGYRLDGFGLSIGYALVHGAITSLVVRH